MDWQKLRQPPWRTIVPALLLFAVGFVAYWLWSPGVDILDGRHDRGQNGLWIGHGWLGADEWFERNNKRDQLARFRDPTRIAEFNRACAQRGITDVFPHVCPANFDGALPPVDDAQTERFLDGFQGRVIPWIGGPNGGGVLLSNAKWRAKFTGDVAALLKKHPRLAGVQLNVEPLPSGDRDFLTLLDELRAALPPGKILSIAAYPPPTIWQRTSEVHWDEAYFREVARRVDQIAVMMYDTAVTKSRLYQRLMADWTEEILQWSEGKAVLLGVPTYADADTGYHDPKVENLRNALMGIHAGLQRHELPKNYQGVAVYCEWETDAAEWEYWKGHFRSVSSNADRKR